MKSTTVIFFAIGLASTCDAAFDRPGHGDWYSPDLWCPRNPAGHKGCYESCQQKYGAHIGGNCRNWKPGNANNQNYCCCWVPDSTKPDWGQGLFACKDSWWQADY